MSMFHELMMRKKEEIMYATIKGTLTENDGVFSGFSSSNYLQLQNDIDTSKDWEFVVKFDNTTSKYHSVILGSNSTASSIKIEISYGTRFFIFLSSNGTSWNIANGAYGLTNAMSLGNTYYMKLTYSTTSGYKLYLSTDGKEWVSQYTNGATNPLYMTNAKFILGASLFDNNSLGGGIDLNRSYVKSQSTKYKFQAVVGYTVVGSPTIVDGVVSGFSDSDYLQLPNFPTLDNNSKVEIYVESKIYDNSTTYAILSAYNGDTYDIKIIIDTTKRLYGYVFNNANSTRYYVRLWCSDLTPTSLLYTRYTIQNNLLKLARKIDLLNWFETEVSLTENFSYTKATPLCIGRSLNGEIHIKNTYIKINNKLWFNGQPS